MEALTASGRSGVARRDGRLDDDGRAAVEAGTHVEAS